MNNSSLIVPLNRTPDVLEALANVPYGTWSRYRKAIAEVGNFDPSHMTVDEIRATVEERQHILRLEPDLRAVHDTIRTWFGQPTDIASELLRLWNLEGTKQIVDNRRMRMLLRAQGLSVPQDLSLLGGLELVTRGFAAVTS